MIEYDPSCNYFAWKMKKDDIPSEHWQQLICQIPYEELAIYYKRNGAQLYTIRKMIEEC